MISSLKNQQSVDYDYKQGIFYKLFKNNIKISVIESERQIRTLSHNTNNFDIILILSNRNTDNILNNIKMDKRKLKK